MSNTLHNADIVHLRPSGNAPELRVYVETSSPATVTACVAATLKWLDSVKQQL